MLLNQITRKALTVTALLAMAACRTTDADTGATLASSGAEPVEAFKTELVSLPVEITNVESKLIQPETSFGPSNIFSAHTEITLTTTIDCSEDLFSFQVEKLQTDDAAVKIFASALATAKKPVDPEGPELGCRGFSTKMKVVKVRGIFGENNVQLMNMKHKKAPFIGKSIVDMKRIEKLELVGTKLNCPPNPGGFTCAGTGGDYILKTQELGCFDQLGPVDYAVELVSKNDGSWDTWITVHALQLVDAKSSRLKCKEPHHAEILIPFSVSLWGNVIVKTAGSTQSILGE